jgi:hypothetical protein
MARKKKSVSKTLDRARTRLGAIRSIAPNIDLGNGNTPEAFEAEINTAETGLEIYNTQLSLVDEKLTDFKRLEKAVASFSQRMLNAVGSKYGFDSTEYEKAGGVPMSKRKRSKPQKKVVAA